MSFKLDVAFIQPFILGTVETLKVQCQVPVAQGKPYIKGSQAEKEPIHIAGIIGINSDTFQGSISVCFPEKTFLAVMGKMLGEQYDKITPELQDGAGELVNIIFGYGKRELNNKGHNLQKCLPTIVTGNPLNVYTPGSSPVLILPFQSEVGNFQIEIGAEPVAAKKSA